MARRTRFQKNDWVKVTYRSNAMRMTFVGKVMEYSSTRAHYRVGVILQQTRYPDKFEAIPYRNSVWCRVNEMEAMKDADVKQLSTLDPIKAGISYATSVLNSLKGRELSRRYISKLVLSACNYTASVPKRMDDPLPDSYVGVERTGYFRAA